MVGVLCSIQAFGVRETQHFEGRYAGNFDFDEMNAVQFANGYTFAGSRANRIPKRA
jgi:hypothetical protein